MPARELYKRAVGNDAVGKDAVLGPLWHLDAGRTFFVGPLAYNALHQHGAPVFLAGIYGPFGLRIRSGNWLACRSAVIPAGVLHELDLGNDPLAVFYIEPDAGGIGGLTPLLGNQREVDGVLVGRTDAFSTLREVWEDGSSARWIGAALDDLLVFSRRRAARGIDPRICAIVETMQKLSGELTPVARLAGDAGLSASRFQHLFTEEVGVPFRRYRAWLRLRTAIGTIVQGSNFTMAAHAAGFADHAHFTNDFRRTFGAPPSLSLRKLRI